MRQLINWAVSSGSTAFANSAIVVFGTLRVKLNYSTAAVWATQKVYREKVHPLGSVATKGAGLSAQADHSAIGCCSDSHKVLLISNAHCS